MALQGELHGKLVICLLFTSPSRHRLGFLFPTYSQGVLDSPAHPNLAIPLPLPTPRRILTWVLHTRAVGQLLYLFSVWDLPTVMPACTPEPSQWKQCLSENS